MVSVNPLRTQKELYWKTFLIALGTAAAFFVPFIIMDHGYFIFYGDFNVQQIPFYQMCHDKVRAGQIFWDWNTDLGVNFIGSYSFYLLGSPFFWLTIPFPSWMVPHLMGPLLILKFACAAFTSYFYIRRFTKTPHTAMIGGLLYAFSGFSVYNIFFNHFHEAIIFFPVLLVALEQFIAENKRGPLIFATFICALSNYFFFFGMAVFCVIYWFVRMLSGKWHLSVGRLFWMLFEIVCGVALAAFLLLPAFYSVMQNSRVNSFLYGWNALLYGKAQIFLNVIEVFFFPPDLPARPVFFTGADVKWSSLGGWMPVFGMTAVIAWLQSKKNNWLRKLLFILIIMALVPTLNSAFYAFNSAYYARWFYMPILMMSLVTALTIEDQTVDWYRGFRWSAVITMLFTLIIGFFPSGTEDDGSITSFGLYTDSDDIGGSYFIKFWVTCAIALASLLLVWYLIRLRKKSFRSMVTMSTVCICVVSVIYASVFIGTGKTQSYDAKSVMIDQLIEGDVDLPDEGSNSYRIDVYDGVDNTGMYLGYPCIQAFHSIVPASITNFYEYCGVDRGVASRPETKFSALRPLLSVKYLLDRSGGDDFTDANGNNEMPGWKYTDSQSGYQIYEDKNYIPFGFTYDYYMTEEQCSRYEEEHRANMMLKAILLSDEQIERYEGVLDDIATAYNIQGEDSTGKTQIGSSFKKVEFTDEALAEDCDARAKTATTNFTGTSSGFTAEINMDRDNLVFFSVPYEEDAWTAYVDGEAVDIENVNIGFMAVLVPEGQHTIEFRYMTPGLLTGVKASVLVIPMIAIYLLVIFYRRRQYPERWIVEYPEGQELADALDADTELVAQLMEKLSEPPAVVPPDEQDGSPGAQGLTDPVDIAFRTAGDEMAAADSSLSGDAPADEAEAAVADETAAQPEMLSAQPESEKTVIEPKTDALTEPSDAVGQGDAEILPKSQDATAEPINTESDASGALTEPFETIDSAVAEAVESRASSAVEPESAEESDGQGQSPAGDFKADDQTVSDVEELLPPEELPPPKKQAGKKHHKRFYKEKEEMPQEHLLDKIYADREEQARGEIERIMGESSPHSDSNDHGRS